MPMRLARWEWVALAALLAGALALRLAAIERIPSVVFHDECDNLFNVYEILNGKGPGLFGFDWKPQPAASVYLLSLSMQLGMSIFTLRLPAALFSVAALVPFYLLLRRVAVAPAALLGTALLATDIWYLHFSRTGWENVQTCLFLMAGAWSVRNGLDTGRLRSFVGAGVWSACGAYSYFGGRAILPALLVIGAVSCLRPAIARRRLVYGLALMTGTALLVFAPQLPNVVRQWDRFVHRSRAVYVLGGMNAYANPSAKPRIVADNFARKSAQLFARDIPIMDDREDRYLRVHDGAFLLPTAVLLGIGLLLSVAWWSETRRWWALLLVTFAVTQGMTRGSLNGARGIIFVPLLYLFVGLTVQALWHLAARVSRPLVALIAAGVIVLSAATAREYFTWVQSPRLIDALQPAIPVGEFPEWQAFILDWTATQGGFFNLQQWQLRHLQQAPMGPPAP